MKEQEKDTLGNRMKVYEANALEYNKSECPVVIRLDGNSFHTWVKKARLKKPFDERFIEVMQKTTLAICETIPGCVMGYTQSDEISIAIRCDQSEKSMPWFGNRIQKLCSISASICTANFNKYAKSIIGEDTPMAYFDSRVIYMPNADEVINCFIWRQNDCIKNSVSSLAQSMFSTKELLNKHQDEQIAMMLDKNVDWNKIDNWKKYGAFVHRKIEKGEYNGQEYERRAFYIDKEIPRFTADKQFLNNAYEF